MAVVASFTASKTSGLVPPSESVTFTDTSTGSPDSWLWDFGDGTFSSDKNPTHTFTGSLGDQYTVTLTAWIANSDTNGLSGGTTQRQTRANSYIVGNAASFSDWLTENWGSNVNTGIDLLHHHVTGDQWRYIGARLITTGTSILAMASTDVIVMLELKRFTVSDLNPAFIISTQSGACSIAAGSNNGTFSGIGVTGSWEPAMDLTVLAGTGVFNLNLVPQESVLSPEAAEGSYGGFHMESRVRRYSVALEEDKDEESAVISFAPDATIDFVGTPLTGTSPLAVQFTDISIVNHAISQWDFGDGNTVTFAGQTHPLNTYTTDACSIALL